jgi:hypothetical protein
MNYQSVDNLNQEEMEMLLKIGKESYDTLFSKNEKRRLEETENQAEIEKRLKRKFGLSKNLGA